MRKKSKGESSGSWFEVVAHSDTLGRRVIEIPSGQRYSVRGPIGEVMIISVPSKDMNSMIQGGTFESMMEAISAMVRGGGFEGGLLIVPENLGFMKLSPVDHITAKLLEQRDHRQKEEYRVKVEKMKEEQDQVTSLSLNTKTVGEA